MPLARGSGLRKLGLRMTPPLTPSETAQLIAWIDAGAPRDPDLIPSRTTRRHLPSIGLWEPRI